MTGILLTGGFSAFCWLVFQWFFHRDRSRYRNCYLLFIAVLSLFPFAVSLAGSNAGLVLLWMIAGTLLFLLVVPFFLIHNGIVMVRREGWHPAHLLSLFLGLVVLAGEIVTAALFFYLVFSIFYQSPEAVFRSPLCIAGIMFSVTVIYGSVSFVIFMIYVVFLEIIPKKKDFDYVIIHGAGLLRGDQMSKLLRDRVDKAISVYRKDPTPPKLIPSGGKGPDETISEAEAMKRYLLEQGIPEEDIILEDQSATTYENLVNSARILKAGEGNKYTALVTSNYHVYRALRYCRRIGLPCTGIGSHVAFYYWPSALIREFIAIHAETKHAAIFLGGWLFWMALILRIFSL